MEASWLAPADLGVADAPPSGIPSLPTQRVSPLYYFEISIFGDGTYKFSEGVFGANIY